MDDPRDDRDGPPARPAGPASLSRDILDHLIEGCQLIGFDWRYLYVNEAVAAHGRTTREHLLGRTMMEAYPGIEAAPFFAVLRECMERRTHQQMENEFLFPDGSTGWFELWFTPVPEGVFILSLEITDRKRIERALAMERERLAVTLLSIGDGVIATDGTGAIVLMNRVAEDLTGWNREDAAGRPLHEVFQILHQVTRQPVDSPVARVLATGRIVGLANHTVLVAKDGTERILADSGAPIRDREGRIIGVVLVFRDVTEEHQRDLELVKTQKLESVGVLAGGIAHDFNNLLTAVLGNISLARLDGVSETRRNDCLAKAETAIGRARELTQQLLTFAKGGAPIRKAARVGETIIDSAGFSLRGSKTRCVFSLPDDLWPVEADLGQLSQVVGNLVINADEAMPGGGTIRVGARNLEPGTPRPEALPDGRFIEISVEDQGIGIEPEHVQRVFEPYFTTKKRGSGLGLATSYSIIRNHEGLITVDSRRGQGSTFRVYLPASSREPAPPTSDQALLPGTGRILLMDDEEMILSVGSQMLMYLGYEVETAADGDEAIAKYAAAMDSPKPFDGVILDVTVPGGRAAWRPCRGSVNSTRTCGRSCRAATPTTRSWRTSGPPASGASP